MAIRIVGVDLPQNKRGEIALTYIYGIGRSSSAKILDKALSVAPSRRFSRKRRIWSSGDFIRLVHKSYDISKASRMICGPIG